MRGTRTVAEILPNKLYFTNVPKHISIEDNDWSPPISDWGKVEDKVYEFTFEQAKERFNESMSVSEDITNKSTKLLIGFASFVTAAFGVSFKVQVPIWLMIVVIIAYIIDLLLIIYLLRNKFLPFRGDMPDESFVTQIDDPEICKTQEEQIKLVYYHSLKRYNKKIIYIDKINEKRASVYQATLTLTFILFAITVLYILNSIFHP